MTIPAETFPKRIMATRAAAEPLVYERDDSVLALPTAVATALDADVVFALAGQGVTVVSVAGLQLAGGATAEGLAVYRLTDGGRAVPTGRAFVQFAGGERAADHADELHDAGYAVDHLPAYAPHAAWVKPLSNRPADGLRGISKLQALPDVVAAEPEMLWPMTRR
ncbi:MAG: hypothetical protein ACKVT1_05545 [Dehalococcoidia bacterium]